MRSGIPADGRPRRPILDRTDRKPQFEELIHYDLIVAEESDTNSAQREEIATTLKGKTVQSSTAVRYEELSKTAGKENYDPE